MDWPALSSDSNPIEHVWDVLQRHISARNLQLQTLRQLENALLEEWSQILHPMIRNPIRGFPRRCAALVAAHGGHTQYKNPIKTFFSVILKFSGIQSIKLDKAILRVLH
jgi:hypothetical protein